MMKMFKYIIPILLFCFFASAENWASRLGAEAGIEFPSQFGVNGKVSLNKNMYLRLGAGFTAPWLLENGYLSEINNFNSAQTDLIVDSISNSFYSDIRLGYRLERIKGFYGELGYSSFLWGKGQTQPAHLKSVLKRSLTGQPFYEVNTVLHNVTVHGGYRYPLMQKVGLSFEVGLLRAFASNVKVKYNSNTKKSIEKEDSDTIEDIMNQLLIGTASLWMSYIF